MAFKYKPIAEFSYKTSRIIYWIGIVYGIALIWFCVEVNINSDLVFGSHHKCLMYSKLGLYCIGCGGTRAVYFLTRGHIIKSFLCHPTVIYVFVIYIIYMSSHFLYRITKGKVKYILFKVDFIYFFCIITVGQWIIKNILKVCFGLNIPNA